MNSAQAKDEEVDANVDRIVSGLFSVTVTMGRFLYPAIPVREAHYSDSCFTCHSMS